MSEKKKEDLMKRPLIDLREMLERENKLLSNKKFVDRLKDKGEKIKLFRNEIERVIKIKESVEETESFLAKLSLNSNKTTTILPKHPMFSVSSGEMKTVKQAMVNEQKVDKQSVYKEVLNGDLDIFSVALSQTFDEGLSQRRSERFIPNRIFKNNTTVKAPKDKKIDKKAIVAEKYKDTALEVFDKEKFVALSMESSLEFGKEQKVKDFEVEKIKLEKRLTWRQIRQYDTDTESDSSENSDDDHEDMDDVD